MDNEKIRNANHQHLSTYGIGKEYSAQQWTSFIRQLIHMGYLYQDVQNYSVLKLTDISGQLLKVTIKAQKKVATKSYNLESIYNWIVSCLVNFNT